MPSPGDPMGRRRVLHGTAALGLCLLPHDRGLRQIAMAGPVGRVPPVAWENPASWPDGRVPGPADVAVIEREVVLSEDAQVAGVHITHLGRLRFRAAADVTLESSGNVVVEGSLVIRPDLPSRRHVLRFVGVDERRYAGGHADHPRPSDVGLWVTGAGRLDAVGAPRTAWTRALGPLTVGQRRVLVEDATGWSPGDRVVVTPTIAPTPDTGGFHQDVDHALAYDDAVVAEVVGNLVVLESPLRHDHPVVVVGLGPGVRHLGAEVLNLTRNVVLEGQADGRAHIQVLHGRVPQVLRHVEIRHMGPRQRRQGAEQAVLGRYALHLHRCGDGSRGTVLEGLVVHSGGGQAFVAHDSHGVTMRDCVAHDVMGGGFWWDLPERGSTVKPQSDDVVYEGCVASKVTAGGGSEAFRLAGFLLAEGADGTNVCRDCVAVGVTADRSTMNSSASSGFHWPELGRAVWVFEGCVAHNNGGSGSLTWQNDERVHLIERLTTYHNGRYGIEHGAYANFWHYRSCTGHGDRVAGVAIHAVTRRTASTPADAPLLTFEDVVVDGAGLSTYGITGEGHRFAAADGVPVLLTGCHVRGAATASFHMPGVRNREEYHLRDCTLEGRSFLLDEQMARSSFALVERLNGGTETFTLHRRDQPGTLVPEWQARRRD